MSMILNICKLTGTKSSGLKGLAALYLSKTLNQERMREFDGSTGRHFLRYVDFCSRDIEINY